MNVENVRHRKWNDSSIGDGILPRFVENIIDKVLQVRKKRGGDKTTKKLIFNNKENAGGLFMTYNVPGILKNLMLTVNMEATKQWGNRAKANS